MSDSPFILLDPRRALHATDAEKWLGRIVKDYRDPSSSFTPDDPKTLTSHSVEALVISDFAAQIQSSHDVVLAAGLDKIASTLSGDSNGSSFRFQTSLLRCLRLVKHPKYFAEARQLPEVQSDLGDYLRPGGKPAYMIVGVMIWSDPSFMDARQSSQSRSVAGQVPVRAIVSSALGSVPVVSDVGDPGAKKSRKDAVESQMTGSMAGSYVFAVEYKAVRRKVYSVVKNFTPTLEDHGPRTKGERAFSSDAPQTNETAEVASQFSAEVDGDFIWTDTLPAEEQLKEIEFSDFALAY